MIAYAAMPDWAIGLIIALGFPALMAVWNLMLSREKTVIWGWILASIIGKFAAQKLGPENGGKVEGRAQTTVDDLSFGMRLHVRGESKPTVDQVKALMAARRAQLAAAGVNGNGP